jgi:ABC-type lipoprotein export system ATPase subunit/ABC-type lipoprotein release transport system permease subunit
MSIMLKVKNLTRKYKNGSSFINAVDDITTHFGVGEFAFVLGASGSGKSTLLNILCGLDTEIEGSVEVDGIDTSKFSKKDWAIYRNHYVGFVFQEYNLIEHLKVWENVALPLQFQGMSKAEAKVKAIEELERVGLGKFSNKKPNQISGGQAQRVAIARALVTNPKVIMADEPTGALDTELGDKIISYLKEVSKDRVVVVVTHDEDLAEKYATRIINLADGKVISDTDNKGDITTEQKEITFDRPKMKFGMMFKFARNNVFSRMFRSIATSTVVSIGYISIFLLIFMIFGINSSLSDTISSFVPEDQYQLYNVENAEISDTLLSQIAAMDEVDDIKYNVAETVQFNTRTGSKQNVVLQTIPYDQAMLTQNAELFGRFPENANEIIIDVGMAAKIRNLQTVDEDSFQYVFDLVEGTTIDLEYTDYSEFETENTIEIGTYTIVGMVASELMIFGANGYIEYEDLLAISDSLHEESTYKNVAIVYLNIDKESEIDAFTVELRDDHDLVLDNLFSSITSGIEDFMFTALKIFIGVASISLIVSGILIGLVVYTSIIERIKEIGILTAVGAKQGNIIGIFVLESGMLGLMSSLIAVLLSLLLTRMINGLFNNFIEKPLSLLTSGIFEMTLLTPKAWIIGVVILFSVIYAVIAGLIPAFKASKLNAIKALRRE